MHTLHQYFINVAPEVKLHVHEAGPKDGKILLFLHGFPEAAFIWDEVLVHFARLGYRAIAPNLRGFEQSSAPRAPEMYRSQHLCADLRELIAQISSDGKIHTLIAHDWGGAVAWALANQSPNLMDKLCIINSPHPATFLRELQHNTEQIEASQYMNFLAKPEAAQLLAENNFARLWPFFRTRHGLDLQATNSSHDPLWLTPELKEKYQQVWSMGLHGGCNYYQASPLKPSMAGSGQALSLEIPLERVTISVPTLVLWGMNDVALLPSLLVGLEQYINQLEIRRLPEGSHWLIHEQPDWVCECLTQFIEPA